MLLLTKALKSVNMSLVRIYILVILSFSYISVSSQSVYENSNNSIYYYLYRNAQKGNIELNDMVRPLMRNQIGGYLKEIKTRVEADPKVLNAI